MLTTCYMTKRKDNIGKEYLRYIKDKVAPSKLKGGNLTHATNT